MENIKFWHRIKLPDGNYTNGKVNHGPDGGDWPVTRFGLPEDLTGKIVLDIGAWDGFFSFEAEKRNALHVIATNTYLPQGPDLAGFSYAHDKLNSQVTHKMLNIEKPDYSEINPEYFDVVLFYGVLYHLKSPLPGLENAIKFIKPGGILLLETAMTTTNHPEAILEYKPDTENDSTNYFYPNEIWIRTVAKRCGIKSVDLISTHGSRSTFKLTK